MRSRPLGVSRAAPYWRSSPPWGLGAPLGPGTRPEARRALDALSALPWDRLDEDATVAIRADRDAR